jgi:hypothetical protein
MAKSRKEGTADFLAALRATPSPAGAEWHGVRTSAAPAAQPVSPRRVIVTSLGESGGAAKGGIPDAEFDEIPTPGDGSDRRSTAVPIYANTTALLGAAGYLSVVAGGERIMPPAPISEDEVQEHLRALDSHVAAALREASVILRLPLAWMVYIRTQFKRPTRVVDRIYVHHNPDIEALKVLRYLVKTPDGRKAMNIAENPRIVFIASGKLRKTDFAWATSILGREIRESKLNAVFLEAHCGCLFVDCGGGGAILDSHGRPENSGGSNISTLDLFVTLVPEILVVYRHEILPILLVSRNDKSGAALAKMRSGALKASKYPHTPAHLRNFVDGVNQRAAETGLSWNRIAEMVMMADEAVGAFFEELVMAATSDDGEMIDWAAVEARMYEGYLLSTILAHLPKPLSEEEIRRRVEYAIDNAADEAFKKKHGRFPDSKNTGEQAAAAALLSNHEKQRIRSGMARALRSANERQAMLVDDFRREADAALNHLEEQWVVAARDWSRSKVARLLPNLFFSKRDDRGGTQAWNLVRADVYVTGVISESGRMGSYLRWLFNGMVKSLSKWLWIRAVAAERGLSSVVDRANLALQTQLAKFEKLGIPINVGDVTIAASDALARITPSSEPVPEGTGMILASDADPVNARAEARAGDDEVSTAELEEEGDLEDPDAFAAYLRSLADDAVVVRGHYRGLTKADTARIVAAVEKVRAELVTLQIHDPKRASDGGPITDCRFGVASTQFDLGDVAALFRMAVMRKRGIKAEDLEDQDLRRARRLARRLRSGTLTVYDYLPEFLSYCGNWFKTNRDLPLAGFSPEELFELVRLALLEASKLYEREVAAGTMAVVPLEWQQIATAKHLPPLDTKS